MKLKPCLRMWLSKHVCPWPLELIKLISKEVDSRIFVIECCSSLLFGVTKHVKKDEKTNEANKLPNWNSQIGIQVMKTQLHT